MDQEKHFDEYAYDWWNPRGHYKFLHKLNPVRLEYIKSKVDLNNTKVLDIGCGDGDVIQNLIDYVEKYWKKNKITSKKNI